MPQNEPTNTDIIKAVNALGTEMRQVKKEVRGIHKEVEGLHGEVQELHTEVDGLRGETEGLHNDVEGLHKEVRRLGAMTEVIADRQDALIEVVGGMRDYMHTLTTKTELNEVKQGVKTITAAVTATNFDVQSLGRQMSGWRPSNHA